MAKKTLDQVLSGLADRNIRFQGLKKLLRDLGFFERIKGDHHIFYGSSPNRVGEDPLTIS